MRAFANTRSQVRSSSLLLRVTLTGFLVFALIGEVSGIVMKALHSGFTPTGIARYYRGFEAQLQFPKEFSVMMEVTHFHLFVVPIVLLVLTHLLFMTRLSERAKLCVTLTAYTAALVELGSPWLVRYVAAGFAWLKIGGSLAFHATMLLMLLLPIYEAWFAPSGKPSNAAR